jgi:hypothetical protein
MLSQGFTGQGLRRRWRRVVAGLLTALVLVPVPVALAQTLLDDLNSERRDMRNFNRQQAILFGTNVTNAQREDGADAEFLAFTRWNWANLNAIQRTELFLGVRIVVVVPTQFSPFTFTGRFRNLDP